MTTPDPDDREVGPADRSLDDSEVDAAFAQIISGISGRMQWDADTDELDAEAEAVAGQRPAPSETSTQDTPEDRRRRREERKAERADELAEFIAGKTERANERLFDEEHFVPPEPPPLPRPKARTVWAVVLIAAGVLFMAAPQLLSISGNASLILGLLLMIGGVTLLVLGLRNHRGEPGDEGWDDGARL